MLTVTPGWPPPLPSEGDHWVKPPSKRRYSREKHLERKVIEIRGCGEDGCMSCWDRGYAVVRWRNTTPSIDSVADLQLRLNERQALSGDPDASAHQLIMRVRVGQLPYNHILWASHLGDPVARLIEPTPNIIVDCQSCHARKERQRRRNRDPLPGPLPLRETPRQCMNCRGSEQSVLERGLIGFAQQVDGVPTRLLVAWATDCAERQIDNLSPRNAMAFQGRYRMPNQPVRDPMLECEVIPHVRAWLRDQTIAHTLYQLATENASIYTNLGVARSLAISVVRAEIEDESRNVHHRLASVASDAYRASGMTRSERGWQECRLIRYLLE